MGNFPTLLDVSPIKTVIMDKDVYGRSVSSNVSPIVIAHKDNIVILITELVCPIVNLEGIVDKNINVL